MTKRRSLSRARSRRQQSFSVGGVPWIRRSSALSGDLDGTAALYVQLDGRAPTLVHPNQFAAPYRFGS